MCIRDRLYPLLDLFWELALIGRFRGFLGKIIKEYILKVKKRTLLLIAGIVWLIAGFNVARLGILSFRFAKQIRMSTSS